MATRDKSTSPIMMVLQAALVERQILLAGPDTLQTVRRVAALGLHIAELLDQLAAVHPPRGSLKDQASVPGEFASFLSGNHAKRLAT